MTTIPQQRHRQTDRRTDRRTDGQLALAIPRSASYASRGRPKYRHLLWPTV